MQGMVIQQVGPAQIDLLLAVELGLFDADIQPDQSHLFLAGPSNILFLAFDCDQCVAMATATMLRHPDKARTLFINELGTRDSHQRPEIATPLMQPMLQVGRERGCQGVWLSVEPDSATALGLYRKLGRRGENYVRFDWKAAP